MGITPDEFHEALAGRADEVVRGRVLKAIEDGDPIIRDLIDQRVLRAREWLWMLADPLGQTPAGGDEIERGPGESAERGEA